MVLTQHLNKERYGICMKKNKHIILSITYLFLSVIFLLQGFNHHDNFMRISYFLVSILLIIASVGYIIERINLKNKTKKFLD
jgi:hypothetical protein